MSKRIGKTIIATILIAIWLFFARKFLGSMFLLPIMCFWVFLGLTVLGFLSKHGLIKNYKLTIPLIGILALSLSPIITFTTFVAYQSSYETRTLKALDRFIVEIEESGQPPFGYQTRATTEDIITLRSDADKDYEVVFIDFLLGEYDILVVFENDTNYMFQIGDYGGYWRVNFRAVERAGLKDLQPAT